MSDETRARPDAAVVAALREAGAAVFAAVPDDEMASAEAIAAAAVAAFLRAARWSVTVNGPGGIKITMDGLVQASWLAGQVERAARGGEE